MQLAFIVPEATMAVCYEQLLAKGVEILEHLTDQPRGHRTVYLFRSSEWFWMVLVLNCSASTTEINAHEYACLTVCMWTARRVVNYSRIVGLHTYIYVHDVHYIVH